jgi:CRISPR-associated protein Cmr3
MTSTLHLEIRPIDTFMFRDGRPFNQGDPGAADAVSVFPPFPSTVSGMVRALINLPDLSISSPVVCRHCDGRDEAIFPALRSLLCRDGGISGKVYVPLVPGKARQCDLGKEVRLPEPVIQERQENGGLKEIEESWITCAGLQKILNGNGDAPQENDFVATKQLWQPESRVGIGVDNMWDGDGKLRTQLDKRRPIDGALYAATHTRLRDGVTLHVTVETLDGDSLPETFSQLAPAGGEHRMAEFAVRETPLQLPAAAALAPDGNGTIRFTIYHASPCFLHPMPRPNAPFGKKPLARDTAERATIVTDCLAEATVASACIGKALMIGGWSLGGKKSADVKGPVAMRPAIPAGSIWFLETQGDRALAERIQALHGKRIGEGLGKGFGQIFIGKWSESKNP